MASRERVYGRTLAPASEMDLIRDYAAPLAVAVQNVWRTALLEFNPEKIHLLLAEYSRGRQDNKN
jgi:hypothetical protein